jgi:hypothetical protein
MIEYREIETGSDLHRAQQALRESVLRLPLGRVLGREERARDPEGAHFAALRDGQVVGCVILFPYAPGIVKLRQMAVAPGLQGGGIGMALLRFAEDRARARGVATIRLHARETAIGFYARAGYAQEGAPFDEDGVPHVQMTKAL